MNEKELNIVLEQCRKRSLRKFIASARGFLIKKNFIVTVRLMPGCAYEDILDVEQWLMDETVHKLERGQTIEFFWQLTP
ncbi:MAG: hypothetical protein AAFY84_03600 [Pseudomonadota bacterium]